MMHSQIIQMAVEIMYRDLNRLDIEYEYRYLFLPVDEYGGTNANSLLALNAWHKKRVEKINRAFLNRISTCRYEPEDDVKPAEIELNDNVPGTVVTPPEIPEREGLEDFTI